MHKKSLVILPIIKDSVDRLRFLNLLRGRAFTRNVKFRSCISFKVLKDLNMFLCAFDIDFEISALIAQRWQL